MSNARVFDDRRGVWAFALGCVAVVIGVLLHVPMFLMGANMGFRLAGMPMDPGMIFGMFLIVGGIFVAAYGLLPPKVGDHMQASARIAVVAPEDLKLGPAHWGLMAVLVVALIIDVMKPASLGFTVPGLIKEYQVTKQTASLVPFFALIGTATGSVLWGVLADLYGRKASILLSAVVFVGTSICGAMPSLAWNIGMCFLMGLGAGGMLPVTYALLAEIMPSKHRGWALVLVGGLGAVGGYFAASGASYLLVPHWSWRILWLLNLPTGLTLILMGGLMPESAKFLLSRGRRDEAEKVMARFGTQSHALKANEEDVDDVFVHHHADHSGPEPSLWTPGLIGKTGALTIGALAWGLINFGLLLWMPNELVNKGYSMAVSSMLLAQSALIAFPTVFLCTFMYSRWSTKWAMVAMIFVTFLGLIGVWMLEARMLASPVLPIALLIIGTNGIIAIILPYASESYPLKIRGRATGWIAACTKGGGVFAQFLTVAALVPALGIHAPPMGLAAALIMVPIVLTFALFIKYGTETRGLDLRALERPANK
jgi:putative MFS transporter